MNIYVGNLSYNLSDNDLQQKFAEFGAVSSANIIEDRRQPQRQRPTINTGKEDAYVYKKAEASYVIHQDNLFLKNYSENEPLIPAQHFHNDNLEPYIT